MKLDKLNTTTLSGVNVLHKNVSHPLQTRCFINLYGGCKLLLCDILVRLEDTSPYANHQSGLHRKLQEAWKARLES